MEHSKLPPSSAARRVACPGSRKLEELYPGDKNSPYALEGEAAHWVAQQAINVGHRVEHLLKTNAPNGEIITDEMIDGANLYQSYIDRFFPDFRKFPEFKLLNVEITVRARSINANCFGTPDAFGTQDNTLHVFDYKYGFKFVEVYENWQLIEYAAGILDSFPVTTHHVEHFIFHIIQPRSYHPDGPIRTWKTTRDKLEKYFDVLRKTEALALQEDAMCKPSPECTYCSARHVCPALQQSALSAIDLSSMNTPRELDESSLGSELRLLKHAQILLEARITGLEEDALLRMKKGERVPFFELERSTPRERWLSSIDEIVTLGELYGVNLKKPQEAVTPKQAIKIGLPAEVVRQYSVTPEGSLKLVLQDEKKIKRKLLD